MDQRGRSVHLPVSILISRDVRAGDGSNCPLVEFQAYLLLPIVRGCCPHNETKTKHDKSKLLKIETGKRINRERVIVLTL